MNQKRIVILMVMLMPFLSVFSQDKPEFDENEAFAMITEMMDHIANNDFKSASGYVIYNGTDKSRKGVSPLNYANDHERQKADYVCNQIKNIMEKHEEFYFEAMEVVEKKKGSWAVVEVAFVEDSYHSRSHFFTLVKVDGNYYLSDFK